VIGFRIRSGKKIALHTVASRRSSAEAATKRSCN
jgi:hypothetical protein